MGVIRKEWEEEKKKKKVEKWIRRRRRRWRKEQEEGWDPPEGEEKKKKFVYVSDVIKNEKVHFFRIPKLGAYLAAPLIYKSYLSESIFDKALEERKKYLQLKDEFDKEKAVQLEEIEK